MLREGVLATDLQQHIHGCNKAISSVQHALFQGKHKLNTTFPVELITKRLLDLQQRKIYKDRIKQGSNPGIKAYKQINSGVMYYEIKQ